MAKTADRSAAEKQPAAAPAEEKGKQAPPRRIRRIDPAKGKGVYDRYVQGQTRCKICNYLMYVEGRTTVKDREGNPIITRQMKCTGPGNHRYPIKEKIKLEENPKTPKADAGKETEKS